MKKAAMALVCAALLLTPLPALCAQADLVPALGEEIVCVQPDGVYPFRACEGGKGIEPTNADIPDSCAMLYAVFAAEGDGFIAWEMSTDIPDALRALSVYLDGERVETLTGKNPNAKYAAEFTKGGTHILTFAFDCAPGCSKEPARCVIGGVHRTDVEEAEEALRALPGYPAVLFDTDAAVLPVDEGARAVSLEGDWEGAQAYVIPAEEFRFRILIGDGNDPDCVLVRDWKDGKILSLTMLDYDEEGYLFDTAPFRDGESGLVFGGFDLFAFYADMDVNAKRVIAFPSDRDAISFRGAAQTAPQDGDSP